MDDARLLDHLVVGELVASQVDLGAVGQEIPVVHHRPGQREAAG